MFRIKRGVLALQLLGAIHYFQGLLYASPYWSLVQWPDATLIKKKNLLRVKTSAADFWLNSIHPETCSIYLQELKIYLQQ